MGERHTLPSLLPAKLRSNPEKGRLGCFVPPRWGAPRNGGGGGGLGHGAERANPAAPLEGLEAMTDHPRIALDPEILAGKPVVRGTRVIGRVRDRTSGRRMERG